MYVCMYVSLSLYVLIYIYKYHSVWRRSHLYAEHGRDRGLSGKAGAVGRGGGGGRRGRGWAWAKASGGGVGEL
jgi:hypothetical protein